MNRVDEMDLTDAIVRRLALPQTRDQQITRDSKIKGFGVRVTRKGARSFVLSYVTRVGRERRFTIGSFPEWSTTAAREEAKRLKRLVDQGGDPLAQIQAVREAPTIDQLIARFDADHLSRVRNTTAKEYRSVLRMYVLPQLRHRKVADISFSDIDALHRSITQNGAPYRANRCVAVVSKMMALAVRWGMRVDNPAKGVERNREQKRHRYLSPPELDRLSKALVEYPDKQACNLVRLLLLTGARRGELQAARWSEIDLTNGVWTKPAASTKQQTLHRVPLSAPARLVFQEIHSACCGSEFVFPSRSKNGYRVNLKSAWAHLCRLADISDARLHDLRHTYASILASSGMSLPVIGALLGHTQAATTHRYAHLLDDPLRAATERAGAIIFGDRGGDVLTSASRK